MCGIVWAIHFDRTPVLSDRLGKMLYSIRHRWPDGEGVWTEWSIGMGHRILCIQETAENAIQPIIFGKWIISFNGEIYNFKELKEELLHLGYSFSTGGDTEVVATCFDRWGLDALERFNGFFAIAAFNNSTKKLYLIRDRFGIKPLYFSKDETKLVFWSEVRAIMEYGGLGKFEPNLEAFAMAIHFQLWIDPVTSFFRSVENIEPGCYLTISENGTIQKTKYYQLEYTNEVLDEEEASEKFLELFSDSVRRKLIGRYPVAAFLSGGIDSSLLCQRANSMLQRPLETFTIHYLSDNDIDLKYAQEVSEAEGFICNPVLIDFFHFTLDSLDTVIRSMEEIMIDKVYVSVYYNYLAAKEKWYRVVLNGQWSDEAWIGYLNTWKWYAQRGELSHPNSLVNDFFPSQSIFPQDKMCRKFLEISKKAIHKNVYENLVPFRNGDELNDYSVFSIRTILHNLLLQEDKLSMAHGVECRVPFVDDHILMQYALSVHSSAKTADGREKYIIRNSSREILPKSITSREKYPFPESPDAYNSHFRKLCEENWGEIRTSKLLGSILRAECLGSPNNFSDREIWWILNIWRFEVVFDK